MQKFLSNSAPERRTVIPPKAVGARIMGFLHRESEGNFWVCAVIDGHVKERATRTPYLFHPGVEKRAYALRVLDRLNRVCAFGGAWIVGWINDGMQFALIWKDQDGDIQCFTTCDRPWLIIKEWEIETWDDHAIGSHQGWVEFWEAAEMDQDGAAKLSQGEAMPSGVVTETTGSASGEQHPLRDLPPEHRDDTTHVPRVISVPRDAGV